MFKGRRKANSVSSLEYHINHVKWKFDEALKDHHKKIEFVEYQLKHKSVSSDERDALTDKKAMLVKQKTVFIKYHQDAVHKLGKTYENKSDVVEGYTNPDKLANNIGHSFDMECKRLSDTLPIYTRRSDIVETVRNNQVSVIIGETGSGKSTQIVQYLYDAGFADSGMIACTQPRKIAATNLATHVASEMGSFVGQLVGHKVGGYTKRGIKTKILYITEYYMLKECLQDKKLSFYSCIVIDEAHERSINADLLIGIIKKCLSTRPDLRVVVTSATINPEVFVKYFGKCPVLNVSGRLFPVEVEWKLLKDESDCFTNYEDNAVEKAVQVHLSELETEGGLLVFVTSPLETEICSDKFKLLMRGKPDNYVTRQLHGQLERDEQRKVFEPVPAGIRKIVFATNSAETSITIPGIKYVIDTGLVKEMRYDPVRKLRSLAVTKVSQSSARQRQGRAGRLSPGKCFRLYTQQDYNQMNVDYIPEMLRVHIGHAMLKLMEFDVDPLEFDYVASPSDDAMEEAYSALVDIGAVENKKLTELGRWIAKLPFDPKFGAFIHEAVQNMVGLESIIMTVASESNVPLFTRERGHMGSRRKNAFYHDGGDQLTALAVFRDWHKLPDKQKTRWCLHHSINEKLLRHIKDTTEDILIVLKRELDIFVKFEFLKPETADKRLIKFWFKTLSKNLCYIFGQSRLDYYIVSQDQVIELHPSSLVLSLGSPPKWVVFKEVWETSSKFAKEIMPVPESVLLEAVEMGWLQLDIEYIKNKSSAKAYHRHLGHQMYREFVESIPGHLKNLEGKLRSEFPDCVIMVKTRRDTGRITVLSNERDEAKFFKYLMSCFSPLKRKYVSEEIDECLGSQRQSLSGCVTAIVGEGGSIRTIMMPEEFRVVKVMNVKDEWNEKTVLEKFSKYGQISESKKFSQNQEPLPVWGQITYQMPEAALRAVTEMREDSKLTAYPSGIVPSSTKFGLKVQILWCRRPSKGSGCVEFKHRKAYRRALQYKFLTVAGSLATVHESHKCGKFIQIADLGPQVTEHNLRQAILETLFLSPNDIKRVFIARETTTIDNELETFKHNLSSKIQEIVQLSDYSLEMEEPQSEKDLYLIAHCVFDDLKEGKIACKEIGNVIFCDRKVVVVTSGLQSSIRILEADYKEKCDEIKRLINFYALEGLQISLNRKNGYVTLHLYSDDNGTSYIKLGTAKMAIKRLVRSSEVRIHIDKNDTIIRELLACVSEGMLQAIMDKSGAEVKTDDRLNSISFHGSQKQKKAAIVEISKYVKEKLAKLADVLEVRVGREIVRVLKNEYGVGLGDLKVKTELSSIEYDSHRSIMKITGTDQAFDKIFTLLQETRKSLVDEGVIHIRNECSGCFYSTEKGILYRLEYCGHSFCHDCITETLKRAITHKDFPIKCEVGACHGVFVVRDFINLLHEDYITLSSLVTASVSAFVSEHQKEFCYCPTSNCPIVYKVTKEASPFLCPECNITFCTHCCEPYYYEHVCLIIKGKKLDKLKKAMQKQNNEPSKIIKKVKIGRKNKPKRKMKGMKGKVRELGILINEGLEEGEHSQRWLLCDGQLDDDSKRSNQTMGGDNEEENRTHGLGQFQLYVCHEENTRSICLLDIHACCPPQAMLQRTNKCSPYVSWSRHHL